MRFERVSSVEETERGLLARLHGETLRVDLIRDDVIRVKISRGGAFDESPSFAVCVDPLSDDVAFTVESEDRVVRLRGSCLVVSLWLDPFRLDVHRPDGSVVAERPGRRRALLGLCDAQRCVRDPSPPRAQ